MLFMQFKINNDRYLLEAKDIIEIVPYANLKRIPRAPVYMTGLLSYRGDAVPVMDICYLMSDKPCELKLSSRIALVNHKDEDGQTVRIGLLIEHLTETVRFNEEDFSNSGVSLEEDLFSGKVIIDDAGIVQMINIRTIIPAEVHDILFNNARSR